MIWRAGHREWDLSQRALIMGILNVTPDSFSDGGRFLDVEAALTQARRMVEEGADILDIGGESTRPGAAPVDEEEECRRVLPVIEALGSSHPGVAISIDTSKSAVAEEALKAGAHIVNDISGLGDPEMGRVVAEHGAGLALMHMQGQPRTMQAAPSYDDVVAEVSEFLQRQGEAAMNAGVDEERLVFDPGIGFGKTLDHNLEILRSLTAFSLGGRPVLLGVSRKSFMGKILEDEAMEARHWATVALTSYGRECGVRIFRVHDVGSNVHAARMTEAMLDFR